MKSEMRVRCHPVDRYVSKRIQHRRKALGLTQLALAGAVGVSFQQVQKYERGLNRVSASMLYELAGALNVSVSYFFLGLECQSEIEPSEPNRVDNQAA